MILVEKQLPSITFCVLLIVVMASYARYRSRAISI